MSPRLRPLVLFLLLLLLFPALNVLIHWLSGEKEALAWWEWGLVGAFPLLAWLYVRHFSILACRGVCRPPGD